MWMGQKKSFFFLHFFRRNRRYQLVDSHKFSNTLVLGRRGKYRPVVVAPELPVLE